MNLAAPPTVDLSDIAHVDCGETGLLPLATVVYDDSFLADNLLARCADDLAASGYRLGGVVQSNLHRQGRRKCDMYLRDLLTGETVLISADRGNEAIGCRLNPAAFVQVGVWGERALAAGVDLLILNKFGKEEARGRGLRPLMADALMAGVPVVVGVSSHNLDAFLDFAGGMGTSLAPERHAVVSWCRNAVGHRVENSVSGISSI